MSDLLVTEPSSRTATRVPRLERSSTQRATPNRVASSHRDRFKAGHAFKEALTGTGLSIIAEIKRRSPSRGDLRLDANAASLALSYQAGGAACVSVLTNAQHFGGSPDDLRAAKRASCLPVLRKDFLRSVDEVDESSRMGADAMLIILADLKSPKLLTALQDRALQLGLDVVTEIRDEGEYGVAVHYGAYMIAVNQRNRPIDNSMSVDHGKAVRVSRIFGQVDDEAVVRIAASGIERGTPIADLVNIGYDAALIGEAFVVSGNPSETVRTIVSAAERRIRESV